MKSTVILCAVLVAGWFTFDGARALLVGDYVTPSKGEYAGQLGPWAKVVAAIGIEPRSTAMKLLFLLYGLLWLGIIVCYSLKYSWASWGMAAAALLSLWYLPFGTILGLLQLVLLLIRHRA